MFCFWPNKLVGKFPRKTALHKHITLECMLILWLKKKKIDSTTVDLISHFFILEFLNFELTSYWCISTHLLALAIIHSDSKFPPDIQPESWHTKEKSSHLELCIKFKKSCPCITYRKSMQYHGNHTEHVQTNESQSSKSHMLTGCTPSPTVLHQAVVVRFFSHSENRKRNDQQWLLIVPVSQGASWCNSLVAWKLPRWWLDTRKLPPAPDREELWQLAWKSSRPEREKKKIHAEEQF